ncbi:MAG: repeat-like domain, partial [Frankiales bacterium]|nr:repeat-like domain [Frankiales bacterium]
MSVLGVGAALALSAPSEAAPAKPGFVTQKLAGSSGSAEPRVSVGPHDERWAVTSAGGGEEAVYHSGDGLHWTRVATPPGQTLPTIDVDVTTLPSGRVITSELDTTGLNFINTYSDDHGKTWTASTGSTLADTDRQWFANGPNNTVYLLFHNLLSGVLQHNMFVQTSTDGGATFLPPVPVALPGTQAWLDLQCADSGGPSGINVNQKTGQVYVFFGTRSSPAGGCAAQPVEVNIVAANREWVVSAPAGGTINPLAWKQSLAVNDTATGQIVGMQLAGGGLDDAGNVYVAYPESPRAYPDYTGAAIKVTHAPADLSSWSKPFVVEPAGGAGHILPLVVGGDAGKIGLTYFTGRAGGTWVSDSAQVLDALSARPHITKTQLSD